MGSTPLFTEGTALQCPSCPVVTQPQSPRPATLRPHRGPAAPASAPGQGWKDGALTAPSRRHTLTMASVSSSRPSLLHVVGPCHPPTLCPTSKALSAHTSETPFNRTLLRSMQPFRYQRTENGGAVLDTLMTWCMNYPSARPPIMWMTHLLHSHNVNPLSCSVFISYFILLC